MYDLNAIARLAKLIALIGFALPWLVLSCSNSEIARGTGFEIMTGQMQLSDQATSMMQPFGNMMQMQAPTDQGMVAEGEESAGDTEPTQDAAAEDNRAPEPLAIGAFAAILLGGVGSLFLGKKRRLAGGALFAGALAAIVLSYASIDHIRTATIDKLVEQQMAGAEEPAASDTQAVQDYEAQVESTRQSMEQQLIVDQQVGFWMTIVSLIVAAVLSGASLLGLRVILPPEELAKIG